MRTALVLLFLLALAAIPGSLVPQRNLGIEKVDAYRRANPDLSRWWDRLGMFDVYASPWFAGIYLLLMASLVGCLTPRMREHATAMFRRPPTAPKVFSRLPAHAEVGAAALPAAEAAKVIRGTLRGFRVDVRTEDDGSVAVAAEKGYLRETGNLLFHFSVLAVLVGVAIGYGWGWYGNRLVVAGPDHAFCTSVQQFDEYGLGPRLTQADVPGYCVELQRFTAEFTEAGQPTTFSADVAWSGVDGEQRPYQLEVNSPLRLDGANVYLLGHGYAPQLRYTDRAGRAQTAVVPFLPADGMLTSDGVALFPDANADTRTGARSKDAQVGFAGVYVPTVPAGGPPGISAHPTERDPAVLLTAYRGNLGLETGVPQSVYALPQRALDDGRLKQLDTPAKLLRRGEAWTLDDGSTLEFLGTQRWITVAVRHDPGEPLALAGAVAMLAGLTVSLSLRRRRVWFRVTPAPGGCQISAAGLPRTGYDAFEQEFAGLVNRARDATGAAGRQADSPTAAATP
ncbi:cytochrome c biogenesis protein ResB [Spirilliplanes yamanashiensis]